jgi:hypothetical protein
VALLRASSIALGDSIDVADAMASGAGVAHGPVLCAFAEAAHLSSSDLPARRAELVAAVGEGGLVEACLTVSAFNGLTRVADATGIQLDAGTMAATTDLRDALGINAYTGADSSGDAVHRSGPPQLVDDVRSLFT